MAHITHDGLTVCTDCTMILVNGDDNGIPDPDTHSERMAEYMDGLPGRWVLSDSESEFLSGHYRCEACGNSEAGEKFWFSVLSD